MPNLVSVALVALAAFVFGPPLVFAQDPVKVDPAHHKVEIDNAQVRVLRITFAPGEKAPLHEHPNAVAIFLSDGVNRLTAQGQKPTENPQKKGDVVLVNAVKHEVENIGKTPTEVILVELKKPGSASYPGMSLDPTKLAKRYAVVAENAHARVIHLRSAAGDMGVVHEHPSHVIVNLAGSDSAKPGTVTWVEGPQKHGTAEPAKTATDVIIVELKSGAGTAAKP